MKKMKRMYQKVILFSVVFQIETVFGPVSPVYTSPMQNEVTHWANNAIGIMRPAKAI
jgi:hypothetical protein